MIPRYAGVGIDCPEWSLTVVPGGNFTSPGTIFFSFQLMNRAGLNRAFISSAVNYNIGEKIVVTIPSNVRAEAWDIHYYILSASTTNNPESFIQIARLPGYEDGFEFDPQSLPIDLPVTIELTRDEHLLLAPSVNTRAELPTGNNLIDGMVRWILNESIFVEYQRNFMSWEPLGTPNTFILDTTIDGSDRNLTEIDPTEIISHPLYPPSPNIKVLPEWESRYFIYNDSSNPLPAGTEFGVELSYNNKRSPDLLNGLFLVKFNGFADRNGNLRTTDSEGREFNNVGGFISWEPKIETPFITEDDLLPDESISISVKPFFSTAELNNQIPPNSVVGILPVIRTQSGTYNPLGDLVNGDIVFAKGDYYRVLPSAGLSFTIGKGMALVRNYSFPVKPKRTISGLAENTANQQVIINGNGAVFLEAPDYQPTSSEALRALISTESGESAIGVWSDFIAISSNGGIAGTIAFENKIRDDYPDVIAGGLADNNAPQVYVYIERQSDNEIRRFGIFEFLPTEPNISFSIDDWDNGVIVNPANPEAEFSLFSPGEITPSEIIGNFAADNYRCAASFGYEGAEITSISHASPPCLREWSGPFEPPSLVAGEITILREGEPPVMTVTSTNNPGEYRIDLAFAASSQKQTWNNHNWEKINWEELN